MLRNWRLFVPLFGVCIFATFDSSIGQDIREIHERIELDRQGHVLLSNHKGSINVNTWRRSEVDIRVEIEPGGSSRHEREWVDETEIQIYGSGRSVRIKTDYDRLSKRSFWSWRSGSSPFVHYTITVPEEANLEITDHKSEIQVAGIRGELRLETHKGVAEIYDQHGPINLDTHKGRVFIAFSDFNDHSSFETHKGDIEIELPQDSEFDLDVDIGDRADLRSDFEIERRSWSRRRWYDDDEEERFNVAINGGGPRLELTSHKGHFRIRRR